VTDKKKITIIATHVNADLDGIASMLAAQKLYGNSKIIFHHEGEKILRKFFIQSLSYLFKMIPLKRLDDYDVERLVLVDTRQKKRLGSVASLVDKPGMEIHIYDHHERTDTDIKGHKDIFSPVGATATIMTEIITKKNIQITPEEATIFALGIYEDTGGFTFNSTTRKDFEMAGYLREKGAELDIISNILSKEISGPQLSLLNDMVENAVTYNINRFVIIISIISKNSYIPDLGFLTHKLNKMEKKDAIFIVARMENRIFIVARSNNKDINIGKILMPLDGGGHAFAGSATIKNLTLSQTRDKLLGIITEDIQESMTVKKLMSSPPIGIDISDSMDEAAKKLTKYNINALLVMEKDQLRGIISRQVIEKARYHNIKTFSVDNFMTTEFRTIDEKARISEIEQAIITKKQRLIPVTDSNGKIKGVITRTDLLHQIVTDIKGDHFVQDSSLHKISPKTKNISTILKERLSQELFSILKEIGHAADETGYQAYLVGGFVRDIMIYKNKNNNPDIDIVVEGDGILFAKKLADMLDGKASPHEKFKTSIISFKNGLKVDVATARTEFYESPAALPTIEMSSLKLDLYRRDFTINTLAVQLNENNFGTLIDHFYALKDLKDKVIRIIHNLSFVEDPTRIFRAIRFESRFGFKIGKFTEKLIKNAIDMHFFHKLSGARVFNELKYILKEDNPLPALVRIERFNLFSTIHKNFQLTQKNIELLESAKKTINWYSINNLGEKIESWKLFFICLLHTTDAETASDLCDKFIIPPKEKKIFIQEKEKAKIFIKWLKQNKEIKNSEVYINLNSLAIETLLYIISISESRRVQNIIVKYFLELKPCLPELTGKNLKDMGFKPGPIFGKILNEILLQKLDGNIKTLKDEIDFASRYL